MISIIIVNYNTRELLRQCLVSLAKQCPNAEIIVVDNASQDGSVLMIQDSFPRVQIIEMGRNAGFAAANNAGLAQAKGEYLVLLNSDTVIQDAALDRCATWMELNPSVGATSPKLMGADGYPQLCHYPQCSLRSLLAVALRKTEQIKNHPQWLAGTCLMLRRSALKQVGGKLDDGFWMYWEDADLSAKLMSKGWEIKPFEHGQIIHYGGASGGGVDTMRRPDLHAWFVYGKYRWFGRHRPWWEQVGVFLLDGLDVLRKFVRGVFRRTRRKTEWSHACVLADTMARYLVGMKPTLP